MGKIKHYLKSEFFRNIIIVFSGASFAQIIPILASPILTRLYNPEEFGLLALFTSSALFFGNIATLQFDSAIMLPKKEEDAINILALSLACTVLVTLLSLFIVILFNNQLVDLMNNERISFWIYFVPVSVFFTGIFRSFNIWTSRQKKYKRLATRSILQTGSAAVFKCLLGVTKRISGGLIIGSLTGQIVGTTSLVVNTYNSDRIGFSKVRWKTIKRLFVQYKDFPTYYSFHGLVNMSRETGSNYIISNFYGANTLGLYSFTIGILQKPSQTIGQSISQVYFQKAADSYNLNDNLWPLSHKILIRLLIIGAILYSPIVIWGPQIFKIVFGPEWVEAGKFAQVLAPWLLLQFAVQPISRIPQILRKQKEFFLFSLTLNILFPLTILALSYFGLLFINLILIVSILTSIYFVILIFWIRTISYSSHQKNLDHSKADA